MENLTPAMRQYWEIKSRYPDSILFFRMGDFYEMFFDDAVIASRALEITLTSRGKSRGEDIPLCGVPYHSANGYIAKLIQQGFRVAICEQTEDPKTAKGVVKREVVRVVTPGTVTDSANLDAKSNSFLAGIYENDGRYGLASLDLSTGEFLATELSDIRSLRDDIARISPREIVIAKGADNLEGILKGVVDNAVWSRLSPESFDNEKASRELAAFFKADDPGCLDLANRAAAVCAAGGVLSYIRETQKAESLPLSGIRYYRVEDFLVIDEAARRNLELVGNLQDGGKRGSLLGLLDETVTSMGGRMLRKWLCYPLVDREKIEGRLDAVEALKENRALRLKLREALRDVYDLERLNSRITLGSANAKDLSAMALSLEKIPEIKELIKAVMEGAEGREGIPDLGLVDEIRLLREALLGLDEFPEITGLINSAIVNNPPFSLREGGIIRDGFNRELDDLRGISSGGKGYLASIEARERERTGINSLKVRYNKVFGYYIEVTQANLGLIPPDYIRKQTLVNAERFITPELKEYETKILTAEERIRELEYSLFQEIRVRVAGESARIQHTSSHLAVLDVLASLAEAADRLNYARPVISDSDILRISDGRHPVVEGLFPSDRFVPNDTLIGASGSRIVIITGPNMAGKSTYIRQVALITIMAQMGSFVSAREAEIGIVDRVFSRVGASDNLSKGQSTFMVEMSETAGILQNATSRSLIILDEIGRGTSTYDGLSIAWSVAEHIADVIKGKTLFATHYHELVDLALTRPCIKNLNVAVREWNDQVVFLHKIVEGGADRSYGIHVAKLAGLPPGVLERAREVLRNLEEGEFLNGNLPGLARTKFKSKSAEKGIGAGFQMPLFEKDSLRDEIRRLEPEKMTPIDALMKLMELKKIV